MGLDPAAKAMMEQMEALGAAPLETLTPEQAREVYQGMAAIAGEPAEIAEVADRSLATAAGAVPVRVYRNAKGQLPVLLYFHGGGWVIGDLDSHDHTCRALAADSGACVIAVDYRRAPEHKYPSAVDDCYGALSWVFEHAGELAVDPTRIAVGGDSAGGISPLQSRFSRATGAVRRLRFNSSSIRSRTTRSTPIPIEKTRRGTS